MKSILIVLALLIAGSSLPNVSIAWAAPRSFRDAENLAEARLRQLTSRAEAGNAEAALSLARYYWLIKGNLGQTERFLKLAALSGTQKACEALIAFYVAPGGVFRPTEALSLRHLFAKKYGYISRSTDATWAYDASLEFRYNRQTAGERRQLLQMASALGSRKAARELSEFDRYQKNRVQVSPTDL